MRNLRILMVISAFRPAVGGGEKQAERLAQALTAQGHYVTVLTRRSNSSWAAIEMVGDVQVIRVGGTHRWGATFAMLFWIAKHRRQFDLIHAHQSNSPLVVAVVACRLWGIPVVCTPLTGRLELTWLLPGIATGIRRWLYQATSRWLAKSQEIADLLEPFAPGKVERIPNGVDTHSFRPSARPSGSVPTVVYVGRLVWPKRVDILLQAWAQLSVPGRLVIVGDGLMRTTWEELTRNLNLRDVTFLGEREDVADLLARADLFVIPSDLEGMPNVLLEAMSCGLACIGSDVGAIPELLSDGVGVTVPSGSVAHLVEALNALLQQPNRRTEMGRRARERIVDHYSLAAVTQNIQTVYREVLGHDR